MLPGSTYEYIRQSVQIVPQTEWRLLSRCLISTVIRTMPIMHVSLRAPFSLQFAPCYAVGGKPVRGEAGGYQKATAAV